MGVSMGPRLAATVVIVRPTSAHGRSGDLECYMLRRSAKSPFMPSSLVFPGGRVDPGDGGSDGASDSDAAFEAAARRECREEASLDLADVPLVWFDTWCTPSAEPRRYFTRFYLAVLPEGGGALAQTDEHETHEGRWASAAAHLDAWNKDEVDLPPPTLCTLLRLRDQGALGLAQLAELADLPTAIVPKVIVHDDVITIVMPHDPAYAAADGEGGPVPSRVHDLPRRFALTGKRWMPC
jgi:8-oxo-dGTP pyrophosphatase MutT (NUDIX family)